MEEHVVGVMGMFAREPLLEDPLDALASVAYAIAQGIGRKWAEEQLEERVNERTQELALLLEISRDFASTLKLKPLLNTILAQLKAVVDYRAVALYALQDDRLTILNYQGELPLESIKWLLSLFEQGMISILQSHKHNSLMIDDIYQDTHFSQLSTEEVGSSPIRGPAHLRSWMGVPLMAKERAIGFLMLAHDQPHYYTRRRANLVGALANQAAVALENARLYEQAQELAVLQERQRLACGLAGLRAGGILRLDFGARDRRT